MNSAHLLGKVSCHSHTCRTQCSQWEWGDCKDFMFYYMI